MPTSTVTFSPCLPTTSLFAVSPITTVLKPAFSNASLGLEYSISSNSFARIIATFLVIANHLSIYH